MLQRLLNTALLSWLPPVAFFHVYTAKGALQGQDKWASKHLNASALVFHLQLQGLADECQTHHSTAGKQRERL